MVMTPFGNCFSAGMCLRIEMRYMPTGSVLQVFLQNVMCCWRYATFKHEPIRQHNRFSTLDMMEAEESPLCIPKGTIMRLPTY